MINTDNIANDVFILKNQFQKISESFPVGDVQTKGRDDKNTVIIKNIISLIPNIEYENTRKNYTIKEQYDWLTSIDQYVDEVYFIFKKAYEIECRNMDQYITLEERTKRFDLEKMESLPEDIIRNIHEFLPYETRIDLLKAKHPNLEENLMKLRMKTLKQFISKVIYPKYYMPVYTDKTQREKHYYKCLSKYFTLRLSVGTKAIALHEIMNIFNEFRYAKPMTKKKHQYFTKQALMILIHMLVLIKPVVEKPKPKPKKKTKLQNHFIANGNGNGNG